jgi:hypothetical protein
VSLAWLYVAWLTLPRWKPGICRSKSIHPNHYLLVPRRWQTLCLEAAPSWCCSRSAAVVHGKCLHTVCIADPLRTTWPTPPTACARPPLLACEFFPLMHFPPPSLSPFYRLSFLFPPLHAAPLLSVNEGESSPFPFKIGRSEANM